jgi:hypothetical protein
MIKRNIFITKKYITRLIDKRIYQSRTKEQLYKNNFNARIPYNNVILRRRYDLDRYWYIIGHDGQELMQIKYCFVLGGVQFKSLISRKEIVNILFKKTD